MTAEDAKCATPGCGKPATLTCPTCKKLSIVEDSHFCSQPCFKGIWADHKKVHARAAAAQQALLQASMPADDGYAYTGVLRPAAKSPWRTIPDHIAKPDYAETGEPLSEMEMRKQAQIQVLNAEDIEKMRKVCRLAREVLDIAAAAAVPGATMDQLDAIVHEEAIKRNCYPSPLNYRGFPKSCCTSLNEVICHGIPDATVLKEGDLLKLDVTLYHDGHHGDLCETYCVGKVGERVKLLGQVTYDSLQLAIASVKPGCLFRDLGAIIQKHVQTHSFSVVRSYCGHGINSLFHCAPSIPHYGKNKAIGVMRPGMCFTIEPMIAMGTYKDRLWPDDWTAVTADGQWAAQFEHTMVVTEQGVDILTARLPGSRADFK
eukprot:CAMPEP_0114560530 /NCGR_PEP_ID=MMETSP0114-20121206/11508_1 /TAXON_ID=31324 /ORGANISM="Goniomonas sp, Strain m" /LENGTH=372 /DNA_ID=CAMNT_0001746081 /DNA_START=17 /DNA_END=1135 /DNA_ORIENTATION=-